MARLPLLTIAALIATLDALSPASVSFARDVNPFIGTSGGLISPGMTFPGATLPFGLVRLSPDTAFSDGPKALLNQLNMATGGYSWRHDRVLGFSHTRLSGTGVSEGGLLRVTPYTSVGAYRRRRPELVLDHRQEKAAPGFYSVRFPGDGIKVELTSSIHCGFHRYTLSSSRKHQLELTLDGTSGLFRSHSGEDSRIQLDAAARHLTGSTHQYGQFSSRHGGLTAHYFAEWSTPARQAQLWKGKDWTSLTEASGNELGAGLEFAPHSGPVELRVCVSFVSPENARGNFVAEARDVSFEEARARASARWEETLGRVSIRTSRRDVAMIFDSALYHSFLMPTHFTDSNGEYRGFDGEVHRAPDFTYRTDFSLWDTFRTAHPLYSLVAPEIQRDSVKSLLEMGRAHAVLPRWPSGTSDSGSMFGSPANFLMAESWLKGIRDFDVGEALRLMVRGANQVPSDGAPGREPACLGRDYCPSDLTKGSVSKTLEHAWADAATATLAEAIGDQATADEFARRSEAFRFLWDSRSRYFRPRDTDGHFQKFSPHLLPYFGFLGHGTDAYVEGSAFQWRFTAPHRAQELISLFGGNEKFVAELERLMKGAGKRAALIPSGHYWHGNQPDLHAIFLFNEAGRPDLTQKWARWALETRYAADPNGLDGNDDAGTLSAWYVLAGLGLYPQAGTDRYWLASPIIEEADLDLGNGERLRVRTRGQGRKSIYVQSLFRNGNRWCRPWIRQSELKDATLEFTLGDRPAAQGGYHCSN